MNNNRKLTGLWPYDVTLIYTGIDHTNFFLELGKWLCSYIGIEGEQWRYMTYTVGAHTFSFKTEDDKILFALTWC